MTTKDQSMTLATPADLESPCTHCGALVRPARNRVGAEHVATLSPWCPTGVTVASARSTFTHWDEERASDLVVGDRFFVTDRHAFGAGDGLSATDVPPPSDGWFLRGIATMGSLLVLDMAHTDGPVIGFTLSVRPERMVLIGRGGGAR